MTSSYTDTTTFTLANAVHIAAKVGTDLKRIRRLYDEPSDKRIREYETEVVKLLLNGYLDTVTYGFQKDGNWIEPAITYTARDLADDAIDDDPGRIKPGAIIGNASFYSYLTYAPAWYELTPKQRADFIERLPVKRTPASKPGANGDWSKDQTYSAGGRALDRSSLRS